MEPEQTASADSDAATADAIFGQKLFGEPEPTQEEPQEQQAEPTQEAQPEQTEAAPVADGFEDVEYEGKQYRVPPELKEAILRKSDYTKKTQEVADLVPLREMARAEARKIEATKRFQQYTAEDVKNLAALDARIAPYQGIDVTQLTDEQYNTVKRLKEARAETEASLKAKQEQFDQWERNEDQQRVRAFYDYISRKLPSMQPGSEVANELQRYVHQTVPQPVFDAIALQAPEVVIWAHKAAAYDKLQASKNTVLAQVKQAPPVVKPGASDPAMTERMQKLSDLKALKNAKDSKSQMQYAEKVLGRFFG